MDCYYANELLNDSETLAKKIMKSSYEFDSIYGIPKGGIPLAVSLSHQMNIPLENTPRYDDEEALIVDDLIDSGRTMLPYLNSGYKIAVLHIKERSKYLLDQFPDQIFYQSIIDDEWVHYFWEGNAKEQSIEHNVTRLIEYIGEDPNREGLLETPKRVIKSYEELFSGYKQKPEDIIKVFSSEGYDQIILSKDIELYSMCEHHMLPFVGKVHVAYIPDDKIVGLSKLARIVDIFARRLQNQERLTDQITSELDKLLNPKGVACIIEAKHFCMCMRGVGKQNSHMVTSSMRGVFMNNEPARQELMDLIKQ